MILNYVSLFSRILQTKLTTGKLYSRELSSHIIMKDTKNSAFNKTEQGMIVGNNGLIDVHPAMYISLKS